MDTPAFPYPADAMSKFRPGPPCESGSPVADTSYSFTGEPVCSSCRGGMVLLEQVWVHAPRGERR